MSYIAAIGAGASLAGSLFGGGGGGGGAAALPPVPVNFGSITLGPKINGKGNSASAATASQGGSVTPAATGNSHVMLWVIGGLAAVALLIAILPQLMRRRAS